MMLKSIDGLDTLYFENLVAPNNKNLELLIQYLKPRGLNILRQAISNLHNIKLWKSLLDNNPTLLDSLGKMNPILTIGRATPYTMFIYLKASNPFSIPIVESIVKGKVVVCGSEEISLVSPSTPSWISHG